MSDLEQMNISKFPKTESLINELKGKFAKQGWKFPNENPKIIFSDEEKYTSREKQYGLASSYSDGYLLGDYDYNNFQIIIYKKGLTETSKSITNELKWMSENEAIENLFYCTLLNEISKWILVDVQDINKLNWRSNNPLEKERDNIHECLTTLFSSWICKKEEGLLNKTFDWLINRHPKGKYKEYSNFEGFEDSLIIKCTEIIRSDNIDDIELFQLWIDLLKLLDIKELNLKTINDIKNRVNKNENCQSFIFNNYTPLKDLKTYEKVKNIISEERKEKYKNTIIGLEFGF